ncbi:hypothetical protein ACH5RR_020562 [Cinchona calisaya]|uniref:Structure-specific endonuclease subunit SLX1 homolog n=1 Tax=Cinchona calisaya TaxID=153742 RepID=A0ABD2ZG04_9GENT
MGRRRKVRKETAETLISKQGENEKTAPISVEEEEEGSGKFYAVYLLTSLSPRFKGHTYIGFTVNPRRRIRQHNGEIGSGAWRTKKRRPWEMVFCIYGFPTNVTALQFEWAWQHPVESLAVRKAAATFKSLSGLANKIKLAYTMLTLPSWHSLNLTVNYFSTKYMNLAAGCPSLPDQMRVQLGCMNELPCYSGSNLCAGDNDEWDPADEDCEQSGGSQESTQDRSAEEQRLDDLPLVEDTFEEIENGGQCNWAEETDHQQVGLPKKLQVREDEVPKQSFELNDSPVRAPSTSIPSCNNGNKTRNAEDDSGMFRLLDEFIVADQQLPKERFAEKEVANKFEPSCISSEVEVIDVFTPSPCYRVSKGNKKRRLSVGCPEIIDLTNSPVFV